MKKTYEITIAENGRDYAATITLEEITTNYGPGLYCHDEADEYGDGDTITTIYNELPATSEEAAEIVYNGDNWTSYFHLDEEEEEEIFIID